MPGASDDETGQEVWSVPRASLEREGGQYVLRWHEGRRVFEAAG